MKRENLRRLAVRMAKRERALEGRDGRGAISEDLDQLSCELLGEVFDMLADGKDISVVASVMDASGERLTCAFEEDSPEVCLSAAREWVQSGAKASGTARKAGTSLVGKACCYAIAYEGAVDDPDASDDDAFLDAVLLEFGERGSEVAYSAYSLVDGVGEGDGFRYTDPAPAGELPCLL